MPQFPDTPDDIANKMSIAGDEWEEGQMPNTEFIAMDFKHMKSVKLMAADLYDAAWRLAQYWTEWESDPEAMLKLNTCSRQAYGDIQFWQTAHLELGRHIFHFRDYLKKPELARKAERLWKTAKDLPPV
jgi:hypothetical protein